MQDNCLRLKLKAEWERVDIEELFGKPQIRAGVLPWTKTAVIGSRGMATNHPRPDHPRNKKHRSPGLSLLTTKLISGKKAKRIQDGTFALDVTRP
jgi:hypothetical protein